MNGELKYVVFLHVCIIYCAKLYGPATSVAIAAAAVAAASRKCLLPIMTAYAFPFVIKKIAVPFMETGKRHII